LSYRGPRPLHSSLHDALPIFESPSVVRRFEGALEQIARLLRGVRADEPDREGAGLGRFAAGTALRAAVVRASGEREPRDSEEGGGGERLGFRAVHSGTSLSSL